VFRDVRKKVEKSAETIEEFVVSIEEANIVREFDFEASKDSSQLHTVMEFMSFFDDHMNKVISENAEKYNMIGDQFLKSIEESILNTSTKNSKVMKEYYYYWERRIYNALIKMVLRGLLSFKNLIKSPSKQLPLFQITEEYDHPNLNAHPPTTEIESIIKKIVSNILDSSK